MDSRLMKAFVFDTETTGLIKNSLSQSQPRVIEFYGMLLHEGQYFDPVMRDIEALVDSSQEVVTGDVTLRLLKGRASVLGCSSPFSMFDSSVATYGETNALWDGRDAEGFSRIAGVQAYLASRVRRKDPVDTAR